MHVDIKQEDADHVLPIPGSGNDTPHSPTSGDEGDSYDMPSFADVALAISEGRMPDRVEQSRKRDFKRSADYPVEITGLEVPAMRRARWGPDRLALHLQLVALDMASNDHKHTLVHPVIDSVEAVDWLPREDQVERIAGIIIARGLYYGYLYDIDRAVLKLVRWDRQVSTERCKDMSEEDYAALERRFDELGLNVGDVWTVWPIEVRKRMMQRLTRRQRIRGSLSCSGITLWRASRDGLMSTMARRCCSRARRSDTRDSGCLRSDDTPLDTRKDV